MSTKRFGIQYGEGSMLSTQIQIIVDTKTGINYLFVKDGYGAGLTPLLNNKGLPIISKKEDE